MESLRPAAAHYSGREVSKGPSARRKSSAAARRTGLRRTLANKLRELAEPGLLFRKVLCKAVDSMGVGRSDNRVMEKYIGHGVGISNLQMSIE